MDITELVQVTLTVTVHKESFRWKLCHPLQAYPEFRRCPLLPTFIPMFHLPRQP